MDLKGKGKKREQGWRITGDREGAGEKKEGDRYPPHLKAS